MDTNVKGMVDIIGRAQPGNSGLFFEYSRTRLEF
jgi:hypothetical protein